MIERDLKIEMIDIDDLKPYKNNAKEHPDEQIKQIMNSIREFGFNDPIAIDDDNILIEGHGRLIAAIRLDIKQLPVIRLSGLTEDQKKAYIIAHNKLTLNSGFDTKILIEELESLEDSLLEFTGFDEEEFLKLFDSINEISKKEEVLELEEDVTTQPGDIWVLDDRHKIIAGDSTDPDTYVKLLEGKEADLLFTDPPYGMGKEKDGILNDNQNRTDLLNFNKDWMGEVFKHIKENGSGYIWGLDEPLMDIYSNILRPKILNNEITFRNLITWYKGSGQGQMDEKRRSYAIADEKVLFFMMGVQGFNDNADNYFEEFEPVRAFLDNARIKANLTITEINKLLGLKGMANHWFTKSQFNLPTEENFIKMGEYIDFGKTYAEIKKTYAEIKKTYAEIKKKYDRVKQEHYKTRAYFNNTHDNMNNVWQFNRTAGLEREEAGGHATPKPLDLCQRAIKSSSRKDEIVLDVFLGSGSTLIASEELRRICYAIELEPKYVDLSVRRYIRNKKNKNEEYNIKLIRDGEEIKLEDTGLLDDSE